MRYQVLLAVLLLFGSSSTRLAWAGEAPPSVCMITSLQGGVQVLPKGASSPLQARIIQRLKTGDTVNLAAGGSVVATFLFDGHREQLRGACSARVEDRCLTVIRGGADARRILATRRVQATRDSRFGMEHVGVSVSRVKSAAVGLEPAGLFPCHRLLSLRPTFAWSTSGPPSTFTLILEETRAGKACQESVAVEVWREVVTGARFPWPATRAALTPGTSYRWGVVEGSHPKKGDGATPWQFQAFEVIGSEAASQFKAYEAECRAAMELDPDDASPLVLLWDRCCQLQLLEEAYRIGQELEKRYPGEGEFKMQMHRLRATLGSGLE